MQGRRRQRRAQMAVAGQGHLSMAAHGNDMIYVDAADIGTWRCAINGGTDAQTAGGFCY